MQIILWKIILSYQDPYKFFLQRKITAQETKFSIKDIFNNCDQICSFRRIWLHLLRKSLMENLIFLYSELSPAFFPPICNAQ